MNRRLLFLGLVVALLLPASAVAVWGGQVDSAHPQVGAMYFDFEGNGQPVIDGGICSGSFAGESKDGRHDVFLTAGHCMPPPELGIEPGDLYVSFSSNASAGSTSDPVEDPIQVEAYYQMPGFGHDFGDPHDLGVLLLPEDSVPGSITPVRLAPAGYLDSLKAQGTLKFLNVDAVGYGAIPDWGNHQARRRSRTTEASIGTLVVTGLTKSFLGFNQNPNGIGSGSGLCFGDSGSPQLAAGTLMVVSVTNGGNGQCNSVNVNYRVDTPEARGFLGEFLDFSGRASRRLPGRRQTLPQWRHRRRRFAVSLPRAGSASPADR